MSNVNKPQSGERVFRRSAAHLTRILTTAFSRGYILSPLTRLTYLVSVASAGSGANNIRCASSAWIGLEKKNP